MKTDWRLMLSILSFVNLISYFSLREILWSIVWLNHKGKKSKKLKEEMQGDVDLPKRISMHYLINHINSYQNAFRFWWKMKCGFVICDLVFVSVYVGLGFFCGSTKLFYCYRIFFFVLSAIVFIVLRLQFGVDGRHTKYDWMRMKS